MENKDKILAVRVPLTLYRHIEQAARKDDRTMPDFVRRLLRKAVEKGPAK